MRNDLDAERWVIGATLYRPDHRVITGLDPSDFSNIRHQSTWAIVRDLDGCGYIDASTVAATMKDRGDTTEDLYTWLLDLVREAPSITGLGRHVETIRRHSAARRLSLAFVDAHVELEDPTSDPATVSERVQRTLERLDGYTNPYALPDGITDYATLIQSEEAAPKPWVIPGLLREGWRLMLVAAEGSGKSTWSRQLALCAANGVHPITFERIPMVRTLTIDLENPDEVIAHQTRLIWPHIRRVNRDSSLNGVIVFRRGAGLNIRDPHAFAELARVFEEAIPQLVVIGPAYKLFRAQRGEEMDQVATDVVGRLDDLRTRHGCALIVEHHAPKAASGSIRDLVPFGSSVWQRWPEFGRSLRRQDPRSDRYDFECWRGDRIPAAWPDAFDRSNGQGWPWTPYFEERMPDSLFEGAAA